MLSDLIFVLKHIKAIIEEYTLVDLYSSFTSTLQEISTASTPELQKALNDYRDRIKQAHERLEPDGWTYSQKDIFLKFGAEKVLGKEGWNHFQAALSDNSANTPGAIEQLNRLRQEVSQLLTNATNILTSLGGLATEMEIEKDQSIIQIVFDDNVAVDTFSELFEQSKDWKEIIHAYSLFAGEAPEKTKIIATSKGSPYTLWLATARFVGETLCATIKPFVELYKTILDAKEKALLLEDMKVGVDGNKFELFKAIEDHEMKKVMEIVENVGKINGNNKLSDGDKNEAKNALKKAGPKLYEFITKGGKVDVSREDGERKVFSNFQLEHSYQEVLKLDKRVQKLLETRNSEEKQTVVAEKKVAEGKESKDKVTKEQEISKEKTEKKK